MKETTEIQEYRKASAKKLSNKYQFDFKFWLMSKIIRIYHNPIDGEWIEWSPDTDANQMLIVWDWLEEQGYKGIEALDDIIAKYLVTKTDIKLATMNTFMEFIETK